MFSEYQLAQQRALIALARKPITFAITEKSSLSVQLHTYKGKDGLMKAVVVDDDVVTEFDERSLEFLSKESRFLLRFTLKQTGAAKVEDHLVGQLNSNALESTNVVYAFAYIVDNEETGKRDYVVERSGVTLRKKEGRLDSVTHSVDIERMIGLDNERLAFYVFKTFKRLEKEAQQAESPLV